MCCTQHLGSRTQESKSNGLVKDSHAHLLQQEVAPLHLTGRWKLSAEGLSSLQLWLHWREICVHPELISIDEEPV